MDNSVTKSDLIDTLAKHQRHLEHKDVDLAVKGLLRMMSHGLASGDRIEIRGFGSFSLHFRPARVGRNPKSGDNVGLRSRFVPHFKPGKALRERVNMDWEKTANSAASSTTDSAQEMFPAGNNLEQLPPD